MKEACFQCTVYSPKQGSSLSIYLLWASVTVAAAVVSHHHVAVLLLLPLFKCILHLCSLKASIPAEATRWRQVSVRGVLIIQSHALDCTINVNTSYLCKKSNNEAVIVMSDIRTKDCMFPCGLTTLTTLFYWKLLQFLCHGLSLDLD